ncbi:hypothetical protein TNCT_16931 [Trichonephila clavata]|uniref:Uncharacterized protein n=1 Tax=Trichonephila clavata TaxID=2740835 RepID=A0A8X6H358_TRICU|nr:hypothetical protein TNCT_16931 [Trichonephila clavata]
MAGQILNIVCRQTRGKGYKYSSSLEENVLLKRSPLHPPLRDSINNQKSIFTTRLLRSARLTTPARETRPQSESSDLENYFKEKMMDRTLVVNG